MNSHGSETSKKRLLVIGNGMVGHRFIQNACERGLLSRFQITVLAEEPRLAYDRVNLSKFFDESGATALELATAAEYDALGVEVLLSAAATEIDRDKCRVRTQSGDVFDYDKLVIATGSRAFVPNIAGNDLPGCFVYRTLEDLESIRNAARTAKVGVVIGGGLLGLEAANALRTLGLETHVVEFAPRLMPLQVDETGGELLKARIEALGVSVHVSTSTREIVRGDNGRVALLRFADGTELPADLVVFSAGIRPRDELAKSSGLGMGDRGGILINEHCQTTDANVYAIGECAVFENTTYGLVAPGYRMAEVAVAALSNAEDTFQGWDTSTKLKLMGVDVGSIGDAFAKTAGARVTSLFDSATGTYKKLVLSPDCKRLIGAMLVGDASLYGELLSYVQNEIPLPERPEELLLPQLDQGSKRRLGIDALPDAATICSCHNLSKQTICGAIRDQKLTDLAAVKSCTKAGSGCGSCTTLVSDLLKHELKRAGVSVTNHLCEHFPYTRQELYHLVRLHQIRSFDALIAEHGTGAGCEVCKPAVASILASTYNEHILQDSHVGLQDTNDRFLANIQRDGTYSVIPRIAAGEVTPDQLLAIATVAKKYGLYTKITGGQRIDLLGARLEQLPSIWQELVAAGFESGHAYGKALRTVKSCVGSTWCRYGVQDSVGLALEIEHRYKGLRSPHKLKGAVSGCARECAEAQGKDFGVIATDKGYNLYVCGNGGMKPQHAVLFAQDLDAPTLIKYLDRFLMFYIRTADKLQRTATWLNQLEGGIDYLKQVIIEDSLGIAGELEADMQSVIETYQCEWKATLEAPEKLHRFRPFLNSNKPDPSIIFVKERAQHRPAFWREKSHLLTAGKVHLPVLAEANGSTVRA